MNVSIGLIQLSSVQFIFWFVCKDADAIQYSNEIRKYAHKNISIYKPGGTEKTAKLSSQVSPENILHTSVSRHVQFSEEIKN